MYWNKFDFTVIKQMPFKEGELDKCTVTKGDLLVCEGGDIGRSAIWNFDYDICIQNHIHRLRPKIDLCVPFYYYTFAYLKENNLIGGKSFIIGYTNEEKGIYSKLPCIIFDDFTTDSKFVDFPFKVKSSAMKILQVRKDVEVEYVAMFMNTTRLIGDTHKRYWISEYSKLTIPIPPKAEQKRIVDTVHTAFAKLDTIMESL